MSVDHVVEDRVIPELDVITQGLRDLQETDIEMAHIAADDLLLQAIEVVSKAGVVSWEQVEPLIVAYCALDKWYA